jgi:hypothetical protein
LRSLLAESQRLRLLSSLETLFMSPEGFGIDTATPLQRAILRTIEGKPVPTDLLFCFGDVQPKQPIKEMCIMCGTRAGKTFIACAAAIYASQTVKLDRGNGKNIRPGEVPRISIVSVTSELADIAFGYLRAAFANPALQGLVTRPPTKDSIHVRHPLGFEIEIRVVPASSKGASLVGRWSAGVIFDEAPRIATEQDGAAVSLEESVRAIRSRMLDGAMILYIGSPVGPTGFVYNLVEENWGNADQKACIVRARGSLMNPYNWTPARVEELRLRDPEAYKTDELAEFRDAITQLLSAQSVDAAMRAPEEAVLAYDPACTYTAVMDPGTRGNSWSFGIADTTDNMRFRVAMTHEWTGTPSNPLSPKDVFVEMKPMLDKYRISVVITDQFMADALRDIGMSLGVLVAPIDITPKLKLNMYESMRTRFDAGMLEIPPDPQLRSDLLNIKKKAAADRVSIVLAVTADGRHCDLAAMLAMLCGRYLATPEMLDKAKPKKSAMQLRAEQDAAMDAAEDELANPEHWSEEGQQYGKESAHSW